MIVRDLHIVRVAIFPNKAHAPLIVDANAVLPRLPARLYNPAQMEQRSHKTRLIPNRLAAVAAAILTGLIAVEAFRDALFHPVGRFRWLFPLWFEVPKWALFAVNGAFYAYLLWVCFVFFRIAQDKERVIVAGWSLGIVLYPIKYLVSPPVALAIQYVEATGLTAAFFAALDILRRFFLANKARV